MKYELVLKLVVIDKLIMKSCLNYLSSINAKLSSSSLSNDDVFLFYV